MMWSRDLYLKLLRMAFRYLIRRLLSKKKRYVATSQPNVPRAMNLVTLTKFGAKLHLFTLTIVIH